MGGKLLGVPAPHLPPARLFCANSGREREALPGRTQGRRLTKTGLEKGISSAEAYRRPCRGCSRRYGDVGALVWF